MMEGINVYEPEVERHLEDVHKDSYGGFLWQLPGLARINKTNQIIYMSDSRVRVPLFELDLKTGEKRLLAADPNPTVPDT